MNFLEIAHLVDGHGVACTKEKKMKNGLMIEEIGMALEYGNALLDLNEDVQDEAIDGFQTIDDNDLESFESSAHAVAVEPTVECDYLEAMIRQEEAANIVVMDKKTHDIVEQSIPSRVVAVRRKVTNFHFRPGKPTMIEIGTPVMVGIGTPTTDKTLPAEPKSWIGKKIMKERK